MASKAALTLPPEKRESMVSHSHERAIFFVIPARRAAWEPSFVIPALRLSREPFLVIPGPHAAREPSFVIPGPRAARNPESAFRLQEADSGFRPDEAGPGPE
jgi:hypothetical protein